VLVHHLYFPDRDRETQGIQNLSKFTPIVANNCPSPDNPLGVDVTSLVPAVNVEGTAASSNGQSQQLPTHLQVQLHQLIFLNEVVEATSPQPGLCSLVFLPQVNEYTQAVLDTGEGLPEGPGGQTWTCEV
jgi:hypothetical protein